MTKGDGGRLTALACLACFAVRACALRLRLASKDELDDFEKEMKGAKAEDGAELVGAQWNKEATTTEASDHDALIIEEGVKYRPMFLSKPQTP